MGGSRGLSGSILSHPGAILELPAAILEPPGAILEPPGAIPGPPEAILEPRHERTGAPPHLSTILISVVNIWEGSVHAQLQEAYRREGLAAPERTDMQARPNACDRRDVHFRMPGFPDLEVQAWFSLIATGLRDVVYDSAKGGAVAGCWHQPPRREPAPWKRRNVGRSRSAPTKGTSSLTSLPVGVRPLRSAHSIASSLLPSSPTMPYESRAT